MRKTMALALAGALILSLTTAGLAQAVNSKQSVSVKLAHSKAGTAAKPKSVGALTVDMNVALDPSDPSFATRSAVIHFDKGLVFNSAKFPSCTEAQVRSGAAACAKARIGSGKAAGIAVGQRQDLTVAAFNGPGGKAVLLHVTGSKPLKIDSVIVGKLAADSGAFGRKLVVAIPANLQQPLTGALRHPDLVHDVGRRHQQGHALRRPQGLLRRQAQVQGRLRLHRRLEAVADVDLLLHEVGTRAPAACPNGQAARAPRQRLAGPRRSA